MWWEKTVEYYFLQKWIGDSVLVAPLDGVHEKAGDLFVSKKAKFLLIEFKRDFSSLKSEKKKFP